MTTVPDANVHCIAVDGSFDDCQGIMKAIFADLDFKERYSLGAINSVNWSRVLAQIVYYGYASLRNSEPASFCVPTGNFGNVFAAYIAKRMNFPIDRLLVATNENDILARFFASGEYSRGDVHHTISPSMDIQVASNFERFLFYHMDCDAAKLRAFMHDFDTSGHASVDKPPGDEVFCAQAVDTEQTLEAIKQVYETYGYVLDPHTAVGYAAALKFGANSPSNTASKIICVATAHPGKFPDAVNEAVGTDVAHHPVLDGLIGLPERKVHLPADIEAIKDQIKTTVG